MINIYTKENERQTLTSKLAKHVISKLLKTDGKEKILNEATGKRHIIYRGIKIRILANFLKKLQTGRQERYREGKIFFYISKGTDDWSKIIKFI